MRKLSKKYEEIEPVGDLIIGPTQNIIKIEEIPRFVNNVRLFDIGDVSTITKFEKKIRSSIEYKNYTKYLKEHLRLNKCSFLPNINNKFGYGISIELHHSPFTLFDITVSVCNRHIMDHGFADEFEVGDEVMRLHYENMVGLIPLSKTVHELIHSDAIDVHPSLVYGFWQQFAQKYYAYFTEDLIVKFKEIMTMVSKPVKEIPESLKVKYTMLQYNEMQIDSNLDMNNTQKMIPEITI